MRREVDWVIVALLAVAAVFLLASLHNGLLWQDEAETALLARNTLRFGYPRAFDGRNLIDIAPPYHHGLGFAWVYSPWLPYYLLAAVFALLGESTAVARLPFALMGWASIVVAWRLARRLTADVRVHRLTVALLTCSVPFLLHMRQCRYYAMSTLLLAWLCLLYLKFIERPTPRRAWSVAGMLALLFHTNYGTWVPVIAAIALDQLFLRRRILLRQLLIPMLTMLLLTIPWAVSTYQATVVGALSLHRMGNHLAFYIRTTNKYLAPLAFMAGMTLVAMVFFRVRPWRLRWTSAARFLVLIALLQLAFLVIPDQRQIRYLISVMPLLALGQAWWLTRWWHHSRLVGGLFIPLFLFTNIHQCASGPGIPLAHFAYELTHRYVGPMEGIVSLLQEDGWPDNTVKIPYDDRTLMFYTDLIIESNEDFVRASDPDWFIPRRGWSPKVFMNSLYVYGMKQSYQRIVLDAPDSYWQNREDPGLHLYRSPMWAPGVVVYRKETSDIADETATPQRRQPDE